MMTHEQAREDYQKTTKRIIRDAADSDMRDYCRYMKLAREHESTNLELSLDYRLLASITIGEYHAWMRILRTY